MIGSSCRNFLPTGDLYRDLLYQSEEFYALLSKVMLHTEEAASDLPNIRKVAAGRLLLAVVEPLMLDYYLKQDPPSRPCGWLCICL